MENELLENWLKALKSAQKNLTLSSDRKNDIYSDQFVRKMFLDFIVDDLEFFISIRTSKLSKNCKIRYENLILRSLVDQIIRFLYLMSQSEEDKKEAIRDFMGENIDPNIECKENDSTGQILFKLKKLAQLRYKNRDMDGVQSMASKIEEKSSNCREERLSLYEIYIILSDNVHNAFYKYILDRQEELNDSESYKKYTDSFQCLLLNMLLNGVVDFYCPDMEECEK